MALQILSDRRIGFSSVISIVFIRSSDYDRCLARPVELPAVLIYTRPLPFPTQGMGGPPGFPRREVGTGSWLHRESWVMPGDASRSGVRGAEAEIRLSEPRSFHVGPRGWGSDL